VFEPHRRYPAQQDREAQAKPVVWHSRGQRDHASIENTWPKAAEFIRVRQSVMAYTPCTLPTVSWQDQSRRS
jgi:hypothetical protein